MLAIISCFLMVVATHIADFYLFAKLNQKKFKITKEIVIITFLDAIINTYLNQHYPTSIRIIVTNFELVFMMKLIYNKSIVKTFLSSLMITLFYGITEMIVAITYISIFKLDIEFLTNNCLGIIFVNLSIIIFTCMLFSNKIILKNMQKILNWYKESKSINMIVLFVIVLTTITCLLYPISVNKSSITETFIFVIFLICTVIFVTGFFNEKSENNRLSEEYDQLIDYLKIYENEINEKSKIQHEFKNQLVIIREMATSKKTKEYITNLIGEDERNKNEILLKSLKDFPNGGLKGLVYYKLNRLPEDAEVHINIGSNIKQNIWNKINLNDLSKIIGILLDNSIDAVKEENNKYIVLDLDKYKDEVIFTVSNSCTKKIDFEKIDQEGYSTKGIRHGYGLPLLNDIIRKNDKLRMTRELNGIMFSTKIYIKIK